jgi:hypothetical protein
VFPRLTSLSSNVVGQGVQIEVTIVKKGGAPVQFIAGDDPTEAAAIRTVDLQRRFRYSAAEIAKHGGITDYKFYAVRQALNLDGDPACFYLFEFGSQKHKRYSDEAIAKVRAFVDSGQLDGAVSQYTAGQPKRGAKKA